jgi:hypothetical protein
MANTTGSVSPSSGTSTSSSGSMKGNKGFLKASYMNLPPATRGLVTVVGVGLGLWVVYKIYKSLADTAGGVVSPEKAGAQEDRGWNKDIDKLNQNPATRATITQAQASSFAASLFAAMDGYGTDEDRILNVFKQLKNDADYAYVQSAYGVREISSGAWNPEPNFKGTLSGALSSELDSDYVAKINKILADKKISYRL